MQAMRALKLDVLERAAKSSSSLQGKRYLRKVVDNSKVLQKVNAVVDLLRRHVQESNVIAWQIGKLLVQIRNMVDDTTWSDILHVHLNQALGVAARSRNWLLQSITLYKMFPKDAERASSVGMGRMQRIVRIKDPEVRQAVLRKGIPVSPPPVRKRWARGATPAPIAKLRPVESLSVRQLGRAVNQFTGQSSADDLAIGQLSRLITRALGEYATKSGRSVESLIPAEVQPRRLEKAIKAFVRELNKG